ncbi:hypothetical protein, partial [Neisseria gonorrhoeae]|uniref:hypothetical protein n=1 Tax=Neisseria gonorrhoeae TaxID=485 RepID=UPI0010ABF4C1
TSYELIDFVAGKIARYKKPKHIVFVDQLPLPSPFSLSLSSSPYDPHPRGLGDCQVLRVISRCRFNKEQLERGVTIVEDASEKTEDFLRGSGTRDCSRRVW